MYVMAASAHPVEVVSLDEDIISLETIYAWTTEARKDFCRRRGRKVTGTKAELCARVYCLYNDKIAELPGTKQIEATRRKDYQAIVASGTDPMRLQKWLGEHSSMRQWPPVSYMDIADFVYRNGSAVSKETMTSYKTAKSYSYFFNDWLEEVFYHPGTTADQKKACFLKAKCKPSQRINDESHDVWVKVDKLSGEVKSAHCTCTAGLSQTCNHVTALLFKVESAFRLGISSPSCTTTACSWTAPRSKQAIFLRAQDMKFVKPKHARQKGRQVKQTRRAWDNFRETLPQVQDSPEHIIDFFKQLQLIDPNTVIFLPGKQVKHDDSQLEECADSLLDDCLTVKDLEDKLSVTKEQQIAIEESTRGQSDNPAWYAARKGRLTASNFYQVHTRMETRKKCLNTDMAPLVRSLLNPRNLASLLPIQKGRELESVALEKFGDEMRATHDNICISTCGLFIDTARPFIGASPDGLVECSCHGKAIIEIKCPSTEIKNLSYLDKDGALKQKCRYFGQIQGQMHVTGLSLAYLYIYSDTETRLLQVRHDPVFCHKLMRNLEMFFRQFFAPALLTQSQQKSIRMC